MGSRPFHGGASLRKTPRITNKTRLKIHRDELDLDFIPDDEEESNRLSQQTQGVDQEDSKASLHLHTRVELHLLQALSRHDPRSGDPSSVQAFIPIPDNTGLVDNYAELYPPKKWKDPLTYLCTSATVEEHITDAIAEGFTYYMDERDAEWLNRNNEAARGEGTSAQGAISANARTSVRNAKGKGKEDASVQITENEFELVMGAFEWVTQHNTEFLHLGLQNGMPFPGFAEYQTFFSSPLPRNMFASYIVPAWIPPPTQLLKVARVVYPHWRQRREERGGHRIIPVLNYDESDTANESYVCFRRRDTKAVRKTRAQQSSSSEKLARLQADLTQPLEIARFLLHREQAKRDQAKAAQRLFACRVQFIDYKRRFPTLGDKEDEVNYLVDKERVVRKPVDPNRSSAAKSRTPADQPATVTKPVDACIKPRDRFDSIMASVERELARQKDRDKHWHDDVDTPYQQQHVPFGRRLFKFCPATEDATPRVERAVRTRIGRGGRMLVDRRTATPRRLDASASRSAVYPDLGKAELAQTSQSSLFGPARDVDEQTEVDDAVEPEVTEDRRSATLVHSQVLGQKNIAQVKTAEEVVVPKTEGADDNAMNVDTGHSVPKQEEVSASISPLSLPVAVEDPDQRLEAQWAFDADDMPSVGPEGSEEQDRVLMDDYNVRYVVSPGVDVSSLTYSTSHLKYTSAIFHHNDVASLAPWPTWHHINADGRDVERPLQYLPTPAMRPQIRDPRMLHQAMLAQRANAAHAQHGAVQPIVTAQPVGVTTVGTIAQPRPALAVVTGGAQQIMPQQGGPAPSVAHHQRVRPPPIQLPSNVLAQPRPAITQVPMQQHSPPNAIAAPRPQTIPIPHVDNHVGGGAPAVQRIPSQQQIQQTQPQQQHASPPNGAVARPPSQQPVHVQQGTATQHANGVQSHANGVQPHANGVQHQSNGVQLPNGLTPDMVATYASMYNNAQYNGQHAQGVKTAYAAAAPSGRLPPSYMHIAAANFPKMTPAQWQQQVNGVNAARPTQQPVANGQAQHASPPRPAPSTSQPQPVTVHHGQAQNGY
ncbi:enhancer of polycomb-like-domain-containing protein [Schizophyllum commune]